MCYNRYEACKHGLYVYNISPNVNYLESKDQIVRKKTYV